MLGGEPLDDRPDAVAAAADGPARLADVATRHGRRTPAVHGRAARRTRRPPAGSPARAASRVRTRPPPGTRSARTPPRPPDVVLRAPVVDAVGDQRPVRARPVLVGQADAAGVRDGDAVELADPLGVRVPADDDVRVGVGERLVQPVVRRVGVSTSRSLRGEPWQKSVGPTPSTTTRTLAGSERMKSSRSGPRRSRSHSNRARPSSSSGAMLSASSRSALPLRNSARSPSARSRSNVCTGIGPAAKSPPTTIASTCSRSTSASTASSAGKFPWTS